MSLLEASFQHQCRECGEHFMSFFSAPLVPFNTSVELFSLRKLSTRILLQIGRKLASEEAEASIEKLTFSTLKCIFPDKIMFISLSINRSNGF
ncbi:hypothetical protein Tco_1251219 [Tanacetum coccineum]